MMPRDAVAGREVGCPADTGAEVEERGAGLVLRVHVLGLLHHLQRLVQLHA